MAQLIAAVAYCETSGCARTLTASSLRRAAPI